MLSVVILTFNSARSVGQVIVSCKGIAARILVVDSYSTDDTLEIARSLGCETLQHPFESYSAQRNWAQEQLAAAPEDWVLHLDSDEVLSAALATAIGQAVNSTKPGVDGYLVRRLSYFLGHPIRYGNINPSWHLRLYRPSVGYCEDRLYDQHFVVPGPTKKLPGVMHDLQAVSITDWTSSHNRWATAEAQEILHASAPADDRRQLDATLLGDLRMKKRWLKNNIWYRAPLFLRVFLFFIYSYIFRLGFLDGTPGLIYHVLQSFWFRFLVDAKLYEMNHSVTPKLLADEKSQLVISSEARNTSDDGRPSDAARATDATSSGN